MSFKDFLLKNYKVVKKADIPAITSVCTHSDKLKASSLFVALKGQSFDGHNYLKQVVDRGATALLLQKTDNIPADFKGLVLKNNRLKTLSALLNEFYNFPSEKLFTVAVTGTNGKTSFCYLLEHIFKFCGWPTALIGTVDQHFEGHKWSSTLTTPDSAELFERLNDFVRLGAKSAIMEVSSHALDQGRLEGINFKALVFTNLTQDHLDYHGSQENYFQAKKKLFVLKEKNFFCLVNQDDKYGRRLKKLIRGPCYSYGQDSDSDFCFKIKKSVALPGVFDQDKKRGRQRLKSRFAFSTVFQLKSSSGSYEFFLPLAGEYNVYNAVSAVCCALLTGFKAEDCIQALKSFPGVPGRLEQIASPHLDFDVFIDYAHTASALFCVLRSLKTLGKKLIVVFGCGGDRDKDKRSPMVKTALHFADQIFFTTDNPRFEDPQQIAKQALKDLSLDDKKKITVELDRKKAIEKALQFAKKGEIVLIAGKGHESFQIIKDKKIPFCDKKVVLNCLKKSGLNDTTRV